MILAKPYFEPLQNLDDSEVLYRFRIVGGSLRDLMSFEEKQFKNEVEAALKSLDPWIVKGFGEGICRFPFKPELPSNVLIGVGPTDQDLGLIKITLKSDYVEELFANK